MYLLINNRRYENKNIWSMKKLITFLKNIRISFQLK